MDEKGIGRQPAMQGLMMMSSDAKKLRCLSFEAYAYDMEVLATTQRERERVTERDSPK